MPGKRTRPDNSFAAAGSNLVANSLESAYNGNMKSHVNASRKKKLTVGYVERGYNTKYNVLALSHREIRHRRVYDILYPGKLLFRASVKLWPGDKHWLQRFGVINNVFLGGGLSAVDLIHTFNCVCATKTPWVVTFESLLPRFNRYLTPGLKFLCAPSCKKIIALSHCALKLQQQRLDQYPTFKEAIQQKLTVLHPPQPLRVREYAEKPLYNDAIHFAFVGADFFRKGGKEITQAFDKLLSGNNHVKLHIVSAMQYGDRESGSKKEDVNRFLNVLAKHPGKIIFHGKIDHRAVICLLKCCHVALLPTYDDTYGYIVLEAQSCGCPVVTTDVRALPEINNDRTGWMVPVPKDEIGIGKWQTVKQRHYFSERLMEGLYDTLASIIADPDSIECKGRLSIHTIAAQHDPERWAENLVKIYREALN